MQPVFENAFAKLTGYSPLPWHCALYTRLLKADIPTACDIPWQGGKTWAIATWLLAWAAGAKVPRRLIYVSDRSIIAEQTADRVDRLGTNLARAGINAHLATFIPHLAENVSFSTAPLQPAVICGTVHTIGKWVLRDGEQPECLRAQHTEWLDQNTLILFDGAHRSPEFRYLLQVMEVEQYSRGVRGRLRVMALRPVSHGPTGEFEVPFGAVGQKAHAHRADPTSEVLKTMEQVVAKIARQVHDLHERSTMDATPKYAISLKVESLDFTAHLSLSEGARRECSTGDSTRSSDGGASWSTTVHRDTCDRIISALEAALRPAFKTRPANEREVQNQIETILRALGMTFHREKERAPLGATTFIPDFTVPHAGIAIEVKLARGGHSEATIQRELAEDAAGFRTKWPQLIVVVYDSDGVIVDPERMRQANKQLGIRLLVVKH